MPTQSTHTMISDSTYKEQEELLFRTTARLKGVFFYRLFSALTLLVAASYYEIQHEQALSFWGTLLALLGLNLLHIYLGFVGKDCRVRPAWVAIAEAFGFTLLASMTGGVSSYFVLFYFLLQLHSITWFNRYLSWQIGAVCVLSSLILYQSDPAATAEQLIVMLVALIGMTLGTAEIASLVSRARERMAEATLDLIRANREVLKKRDELQSSETRLRLVLDTAAEGIFGVDLQGNCIFANQSCLRMLGYEHETALLGRNMHELMHHTRPDGRPYPKQECHVFDAMHNEKSAHCDSELHWRSDGTSFPVEYWSHPIYTDSKVSGAVVTFIDITERREQEAAMQRRLAYIEQHKLLLAELPMLPELFAGDFGFVARWVTERAAHIMQTERVSVWLYDENKTSLHCIDLFQASKAEHSSGMVLQEADFGNEFQALKRSKYVDASDPYTDPRTAGYIDNYLKPLNITAMLDVGIQSGQQHFGLICFEHVAQRHTWDQDEINLASQISDQLVLTLMHGRRRRDEDALRELNTDLESRVEKRTAELEQSNRQLMDALHTLGLAQEELVRSEKLASLGSLVAGVAHELNTPLGNSVTVATAFSEKVQSFTAAVDTGDLRRSSLHSFLEQADMAMKMLTKNLFKASELITHFKQVAVDQTSAQRRPFDLAEVLEEVVMTLQPQVKNSTTRIKLLAPPSIAMDSFPGPLGQVVTNLISNALIHGLAERADGGLVNIEAQQQGSMVRLTVSDNGTGIAEELQSRVFDPFFTTRLGKGGSGLGLHIVYSIVTRVLGGKIEIQSAPGIGTAFIIDIPLIAPTEESHESGRAARP